MRKLLITLLVIIMTSLSASAAKVPNEVVNYIKRDFPKAEIRFDGLITIDDVIYLPLYPAKVLNPQNLAVKRTAPANKTLKSLPDIVVFNNDFVLMKVIEGTNGKRSVLYQQEPFIEVRTGLLPQDLLVPRGLSIPSNIKTIIGGLRIATEQDNGLKVQSDLVKTPVNNSDLKKDFVANINQLKNKNLYVITCHSKNIHVVPSESSKPAYALSMSSIPVDIKSVANKFLMVTSFGNNYLSVISLADEAVIKDIEFPAQPEEIVIDSIHNKAYISVPSTSSIYLIDLATMQLKQKIQVNGMCTKLYLTNDASKLIYVDKQTNDVWSIELNNDYTIKEVGTFPNVSSIAYSENKIYLASRTKNRIVIVDYVTMSPIDEFEVSAKPVDMYLYYGNLYILSAQKGVMQVLNTQTDKITHKFNLPTAGFATKIYRLPNSNLALVTDAVGGKYFVLNLDKKQIIKTLPISISIGDMVVTDKVKKINK